MSLEDIMSFCNSPRITHCDRVFSRLHVYNKYFYSRLKFHEIIACARVLFNNCTCQRCTWYRAGNFYSGLIGEIYASI